VTITLHKSRVKTIRQGESDFMLKDGMVTYPRAMLELLPNCPLQIANDIAWAVENGYIKCVANVYSTEHLRDVLMD
jgi:hypothetical protein